MAQIWDADIQIDETEAKRMIASQFPGLAPVRIEPFGTGWDNVAYRVNDDFVFRFPRRKIALRLLENEINSLGRIAPRVPARVPSPEFVGRPVDGVSHPFAGYRLIAGTTACRANLTDDERTNLAAPLARFLAALHSTPIDPTFPGDELKRSDIVGRRGSVIERLWMAAPLVPDIDFSAHISAVECLAATPLAKPGDLRLLHGDLYARHIIVDDSRVLAGVIDWGDVHVGDPALDVSIAFSFLPASAHGAFHRAYGVIDAATWDRARFRAIHYGALLTQYGTEIGDDAIRDVGIYALRATAE